MATVETAARVIGQLGALAGMARVEGLAMTHVKPHGALSNMASEDASMARNVVQAIKAFDAELILLAPAGSQLDIAGRRAGLRVAGEIFADRAYTDDGHLVPRSQPGAVLTDSEAVAARAVALAASVHSVCVHGDSPSAVDHARACRRALEAAGWELAGL